MGIRARRRRDPVWSLAGKSKLKIKSRTTPNAGVDTLENGWRLRIPEGDASSYRLAQLDDYFQLSRRRFPHRSHTLGLRARATGNSIPGTWGVGLWNDPFGYSLGSGGNPFQIPMLPNAVWFFSASKENHLSFKEPSSGTEAAHGFLAQAFRSPRFHPLLVPAALAFPFSQKATRKLLGRVIDEETAALEVDVTKWHGYRLEWTARACTFWVDGRLVLETTVSPRPPLGLVMWIDNQFAAFTPEGKIGFGVLENPEPAWIEICDLDTKGA
jgi:hypothetical protein